MHISPDIDTLLYTLSGNNNADTGWGRANETWSFMQAMSDLQQDNWFQLGDKDIALHIYRTSLLRQGQTLSKVTKDLASKFKIGSTLLPMSNEPVNTMIVTESGELPFQHYFVKYQCEPVIQNIYFKNSQNARITPDVLDIIKSDQLQAIIICPSNPYLSIDPILSIPGMSDALIKSDAPVVVISPIVASEALKGPTAKIMGELGLEASAMTIMQHYKQLMDGFVFDAKDADLVDEITACGVETCITNTVMQTLDDRKMLAQTVLEFTTNLSSHGGSSDVGYSTG